MAIVTSKAGEPEDVVAIDRTSRGPAQSSVFMPSYARRRTFCGGGTVLDIVYDFGGKYRRKTDVRGPLRSRTKSLSSEAFIDKMTTYMRNVRSQTPGLRAYDESLKSSY